MQLKQILTLSTSISALLFLSACGGGGTDYKFTQPTFVAEPSPTAVFSPAEGGPSTNNLLFAGSTDGTLNIPVADDDPRKRLIDQLNTLDGFSTINPIATNFGTALDASSLVVGESIRVFEVSTTAAGAVTGVVSELAPNEITAVATGADNKTLALLPLRPLKESTTYMVVLTNAIKDASGASAKSSSTYLLLKSAIEIPDSATPDPTQLATLRALRPAVNAMETVAASASVAKDSIVLSWAFTTQSITPALDSVAAMATAGTLAIAPTGATPQTFIPTSAGISDVFIGTLDVPYYLKEPDATDPLAALTSFWKGAITGNTPNGFLTRSNSTPIATDTMTMPLMLTIPKETETNPKPEAGWPIVMYQHGITRVRTDMLVYADNLAKAGFALIAIDLPMHGITDPSIPFMADNTPFPNDREQTFNMDFATGTTPGTPDGAPDPSGTHFINLGSLLTSRDNIRQGVSNLLTLRRSLGNIPNINADKVGFIAHSLGGVVGATYLGVETKPLPSTLMTMGGGISGIVENSGSFGPPVIAGLAAQGVTGDSLRAFFISAQTILDPADPINFASSISSVHPIHMIEVVGDGTDANLPDQTIPNLVSPLSGTEPLAALMGLKSVSSTVRDIAPTAGGIVRFTQGEHASILRPSKNGGDNSDYLHVFIEMHRQVAAFQASFGTAIVITDDTIIKQ